MDADGGAASALGSMLTARRRVSMMTRCSARAWRAQQQMRRSSVPLVGGVPHTVARARGEVGPTRGITVIAAPGAAAAAVIPGVLSTPGLPRGGDARGAARGRAARDGLDLRMRMNARFLGRTVASGAHLGLYEHGTYHKLVVKA